MVDSLTRQSDAGTYGVRAPQMSDAGTYHGDPVVDYVRAPQLVQTMIEAGASKQNLPAGQIFVRGMFGGALLAYATGIAFFAAAQGVPPVIAGLLFPVGFIIINLIGFDLITGYFALVPMAVIHGRMTFGELGRTWWWVWVGRVSRRFPGVRRDGLDLVHAYGGDQRYNRGPVRLHNQDCHRKDAQIRGVRYGRSVRGARQGDAMQLDGDHGGRATVLRPLGDRQSDRDVRTDLHVLCDGVRTHGGQPVHHPDCNDVRCPDLAVRLLGRKSGPGDDRQFPRWVLVHRRRTRLALLHAQTG